MIECSCCEKMDDNQECKIFLNAMHDDMFVTITNTGKEVLTMAKCAVCGKGVHFGNAVSHSHRRSNKIWKPNIKSVRVKTAGGSKKMSVCTRCLRSGAVERA